MVIDSDDSDNEIIVKTLFPVDKAVSVVESPNNSDLQEDYQGSADINTSDNKDGDEVIEKVARQRMEFPCSSQCKMSPKSSSLNSTTNLQGNCSHQESNNSKTKASQQGKYTKLNWYIYMYRLQRAPSATYHMYEDMLPLE